ncbi:WGR domain-containing protein [Kitasatospora arboriphila]
MRRWEFVEGGSDKFWEAAVDGAAVTVRYGRSGTNGREQVKAFPTVDEAQAHFAKAVAEKERKGYREIGAGAGTDPGAAADPVPVAQPGVSAPTAEAAGPEDEDVFVMPDAWRRALIPRRGGIPRKPSAPGKEPVTSYRDGLRQMGDWLEQTLTSERSDSELVAAARAHQSGSRDPLGAAVLAAVYTYPVKNKISLAVDAWVEEFGLPFAARATVELFTTAVETDWIHQRSVHPRVRRGANQRHGRYRPAADRVRSLLADCDEETHRAAVEALAGCRNSLTRLVVAAYLVPSETAWVEECVASGSRLAAVEWSMLLCSLSSAEPLEKLPRCRA